MNFENSRTNNNRFYKDCQNQQTNKSRISKDSKSSTGDQGIQKNNALLTIPN